MTKFSRPAAPPDQGVSLWSPCKSPSPPLPKSRKNVSSDSDSKRSGEIGRDPQLLGSCYLTRQVRLGASPKKSKKCRRTQKEISLSLSTLDLSRLDRSPSFPPKKASSSRSPHEH